MRLLCTDLITNHPLERVEWVQHRFYVIRPGVYLIDQVEFSSQKEHHNYTLLVAAYLLYNPYADGLFSVRVRDYFLETPPKIEDIKKGIAKELPSPIWEKYIKGGSKVVNPCNGFRDYERDEEVGFYEIVILNIYYKVLGNLNKEEV